MSLFLKVTIILLTIIFLGLMIVLISKKSNRELNDFEWFILKIVFVAILLVGILAIGNSILHNTSNSEGRLLND